MQIEILRRAPGETESYLQTFDYEPENSAETVATALTRLNARPELKDIHGQPARPVRWECSCLQKKCGACAMVIDGIPALACSTRLMPEPAGTLLTSLVRRRAPEKTKIRLEPLRKFPVIEDLAVDRSVLFENLRELRVWLEKAPELQETGTGKQRERREAAAETAYEASRCLQCGCCLEVCPNFMPGGTFAGMAAAVPMTRLFAEAGASGKAAELYRKRIYEGCGKSLACRNICPAGIDIDRMLVNSNAIAVWKRLLK